MTERQRNDPREMLFETQQKMEESKSDGTL